MMLITEKTYSSPRINIIDILRGFALYGIILAHVGAVYLYESDITSSDLTGLNGNIKKLLELFVERKFYLIFSFLFGLSFSIQLNNAIQRNKPFVLRYCWRLCILFFIGFIHNQLYPFDILQVYAIMGVLLLPIRKLPPSKLLTLAIFLFLFSCLFSHFDTYVKTTLLTPTFGQLGLSRILMHQIASGHFFMILSLFILGLWTGKNEIFSYQSIDTRFFLMLLFCSLTILLALRAVKDITDTSLLNTSVVNICFSFLYISIICLLHKHLPKLKPLWLSLEAIGRMGLTNYIIQTIFFYILFRYRTDLLNEEGQLSLLFVYANFFFLFQAIFSLAWFKWHRFGPIEWVWRITTDLYKTAPQSQPPTCNAQHNI